ncbi:hypothetical protein [Halorubrum sp. BOL3-1]|uniref:hypothetical protein n=1 Tax=Halorubrum sp. BOL3-1 TaxID=2497325 RepID=UPI001F4FDB37|nr:hypothetical protein [Halorubrum sp. BOL3-1]
MINAVRLQAATNRLTDGSFPVNHPKDYLGYALAADGDTDRVYADNVINAISGGRHGTILLNLVDNQPTSDSLVHLGAEVVRFARQQHGSVTAALAEFDRGPADQRDSPNSPHDGRSSHAPSPFNRK